MIRKELKIIAVIIALILSGCVNCKTELNENKDVVKNSIKQIAGEKFGKDYTFQNNSSKTFTICLSNNNSKSLAINKLKYFVYDFNKAELIFEDSLINCNIGWENDSIFSVTKIPGIVKKDSESNKNNVLYSFDVFQRKK